MDGSLICNSLFWTFSFAIHFICNSSEKLEIKMKLTPMLLLLLLLLELLLLVAPLLLELLLRLLLLYVFNHVLLRAPRITYEYIWQKQHEFDVLSCRTTQKIYRKSRNIDFPDRETSIVFAIWCFNICGASKRRRG